MGRTIFASAPPRIDFGGGTLDIYPLYLFFDGGITINAAIDLYAQVWLTEREDATITITSEDTGATLEVEGGLDALPLDGRLALITRLLRYYRPSGGIDVRTNLLTPHGSGLGASSTLFIALSHALLAYNGVDEDGRDPERIIRTSNNLEAQLMGMPAGMQDYYSPTYGGINAVHYDLEGVWREDLDPDFSLLAEMQQYILVANTNITHHSGMTNWQKIRNFFDGVPRTVDSLHRIKATVQRFYAAFQARDIEGIARLLNEEWENRKGLSDGVTSPEIDNIIHGALGAGAWGTKLCGAGGGGCILVIAPPATHGAIHDALRATGATPMDVHLVEEGVRVSSSALPQTA